MKPLNLQMLINADAIRCDAHICYIYSTAFPEVIFCYATPHLEGTPISLRLYYNVWIKCVLAFVTYLFVWIQSLLLEAETLKKNPEFFSSIFNSQ